MPTPEEAASLIRTRGVHVVGDFGSQCGLSQSARDVRQTLERLGGPVAALDLPVFAGREKGNEAALAALAGLPVPEAPISLLNLNADHLPGLARLLPRTFFDNRYLIGIWYWETEIFPPHQQAGFDYVDEVWVASRHIRTALEKVSPVPVRQFIPLVHPPEPAGPEALPAALQNQRFLFLFCFDYRSTAARKNPAAACAAFVRAFPEASPGGPLCVIKSVAAHPGSTLEHLDLQHRFRHRRDIIFMDGWLSTAQRDGLMNRADCYVSLHRAEGLGLTILESMSLGKPCIGTAYSGNLDFMTPENSWLIPCQMVPVGPRHHPFPPDHPWAEPDPAAAAAAMREAFDNPGLLREKGRRARETVLTRHGPDAVGQTMRDLLLDAATRPPRIKPGLTEAPVSKVSHRSQANELRKQAKALLQTTRQQLKTVQGWNAPEELKQALKAILDLQRLQLDAQSPILEELAAIRRQINSFDAPSFDALIRSRGQTARLLQDLTATPPA